MRKRKANTEGGGAEPAPAPAPPHTERSWDRAKLAFSVLGVVAAGVAAAVAASEVCPSLKNKLLSDHIRNNIRI